jgi:hypothetical protein
MRVQIFEIFARTIANLRVQCILKALDLECQMLKSDVESKRLPLPEDASSIFYFREFVNTVKLGRALKRGRLLPPDHAEFFKETIVRLVQANELPQAAMDKFDFAFANDAF